MTMLLNRIKWAFFFWKKNIPHKDEIALLLDKNSENMHLRLFDFANCYAYYGDVGKVAEVMKCTRERVRQVLLKIRRKYSS